MFNRLKKAMLYVFIVILGSLAGTNTVNAAYKTYHNGFSPIPAYVKGYSGFSSETNTAIHNSCVTWNSAGSGNLVYRNIATHNSTQYPNYNSVNEITKGYRGSAYYMETKAYLLNGKCIEADIDINVDYPWADGSINPNVYDIQSTMTHELGHLLGLDEVTDSQSYADRVTMYGGNFGKGTIEKRTLHADDIRGLDTIY